MHLRDLSTGKDTGLVVTRMKFSQIRWAPDASGFWYSRLPDPDSVPAGQEQLHRRVRFHRLADPLLLDDELVYGTGRPDIEGMWVGASTDEKTSFLVRRHALPGARHVRDRAGGREDGGDAAPRGRGRDHALRQGGGDVPADHRPGRAAAAGVHGHGRDGGGPRSGGTTIVPGGRGRPRGRAARRGRRRGPRARERGVADPRGRPRGQGPRRGRAARTRHGAGARDEAGRSEDVVRVRVVPPAGHDLRRRRGVDTASARP